jgi:hypothetical protein
MADVAVGDTVFDMSGAPVPVVGKSEVKNLRCYEITFECGQKIVCDEQHEWVHATGKVTTALGLIATVKKSTSVKRPQNRSVPINAALQGCSAELPISPYTLGAWLADGRAKGGEIGKPYPEMWDGIRAEGWHVGDNTAVNSRSKCPVHTVYGLRTAVKKHGLFDNKHIPPAYFRASYEARLALLRGLMDGDGSANKVRGQLVFVNCNRRLSEDVAALLRTLGARAHVNTTRQTGFGLVVTAYPVTSRLLPVSAFTIAHKKANEAIAAQKRAKMAATNVVVSVREVPSVPTQCIQVDSPTSTFLCGDFLIPTHNCGKYRGKTNQAVINAYHVFAAEPEVELVHTVFDYMTAGVKDTNTFRRENIVRDFAPVQKLVTDLENSVVYENFPQRRNGLCKDWCSAVKCPLNGRYRGGF